MRVRTAVAAIGVVVLAALIAVPIVRERGELQAFQDEVAALALPAGATRVAIASAVGDSGGNGDQSTLRVVMVVEAPSANPDTLQRWFRTRAIAVPQYSWVRDGEDPPVFVRPCESDEYESMVSFHLTFADLSGRVDYRDLYFVEFIT